MRNTSNSAGLNQAEGKELPILRKLFKNDAQGMLTTVFILIVIGSINIFSATFVADRLAGSMIWSHFLKHIGSLVFACGFGWLAYKIDYRRYRDPQMMQIIAAIILIGLVSVFAFGTVVNGARRWIMLPIFSIQPSEFAKLGAVLWAAAAVSRRVDQGKPVSVFEMLRINGKPYPFLAKALWMPLVYFLLTLKQPDMGTAVLILFFALLIMILAGMHLRTVFTGGIIVLVLGALAIMAEPYRRERIISWYDPWRHAQDLGYQTVQGLIAIGSGGFLGMGFAKGTSKYFYLPEAHTDFAFAVWAQEIGLLGSLLVVLLVLIFTYYGMRITLAARDNFGRFTAAGITMLISGQAVFNMLMVCGVMPVTGVPLPFISYGGSSLLMNIIAVGVLANISRRSNLARRTLGPAAQAPSLREETQSRFRPNRPGRSR